MKMLTLIHGLVASLQKRHDVGLSKNLSQLGGELGYWIQHGLDGMKT